MVKRKLLPMRVRSKVILDPQIATIALESGSAMMVITAATTHARGW
jgi:hypothetical protein